MNKDEAASAVAEEEGAQGADHHPKQHSRWHRYSPKSFVNILATTVVIVTLFQIYSSYFDSLPSSWTSSFFPLFTSASSKQLPHSVTFLPLKDLRYADSATEGHTWFMSSLNDTHVDGEVQYVQFPSESSRGKLLCVKGRDINNGSRNHYALAWPKTLPESATFKKGLTFVSNSHYVYDNIWHGLSAMVPWAAWHLRNGCRSPARGVLYFKGELRTRMPLWLSTLNQAIYGKAVKLDGLEGVEGEAPVCFEEAVVTRHNEGGMSKRRLQEVFDLLRCKARAHCNVSADKSGDVVKVSMLLRSGGRSFKNDTHVIRIFETECRKIQGCRLQVAYSNNLTVCQQVKIMSETNVLISAHGAQMTNLFLMDKGSSVMEFFPKGWLQLAGVGQYVFRWLADWSGMRHRGDWRDPDGPPCKYPEDDHRCMSIYKNAQIGHNKTHFREWARTVFNEVRTHKLEEVSKRKESDHIACGCP